MKPFGLGWLPSPGTGQSIDILESSDQLTLDGTISNSSRIKLLRVAGNDEVVSKVKSWSPLYFDSSSTELLDFKEADVGRLMAVETNRRDRRR